MEANVVITRTYRSMYQSGRENTKTKSKFIPKIPTEIDSNETLPHNLTSNLNEIDVPSDEITVYIEAVYDEYNKLVRLNFNKKNTIKIPRLIFKIIGLILHFHTSLSSIIISSGAHAAAIYEISKFLPKSNITEICLDYTYVPEGNYHILLKHDNLKHLSLSKCNVNDATLQLIASELLRMNPTPKLCALNLATNQITDVGAKCLAEVLRSNRNIGYLNLSDNMISDDGAISIFNILMEFPLTPEEATERRSRLMVRLIERNNLLQKTMKNMQEDGDLAEKKMARRKAVKPPLTNALKKKIDSENTMTKSMEMILYERAEIIVDNLMGPGNDPFSPGNVEFRGTTVYCLGNNVLSYLNIAYNNLSNLSIKKLCDVLKQQKLLARRPRGLVNVVIEGNYLSDSCSELKFIDDSLGAILSTFRKASTTDFRRKSVNPGLSSK
ncbi:leucine-rich repeat-containing protein 71-like [Spodoptera litura]|uniref:Leucine-rich repeat-containing protein 71-like n=1 Tax=Spodoptera litura TaxID=69820 RepID=A0A9J7EWN8_SPOLT|nr:leucine-rich repeat-containing protein 71-like [Spodoptera litura]